MWKWIIILVVAILILNVGVLVMVNHRDQMKRTEGKPATVASDPSQAVTLTVTTPKGPITLAIYPDQMPATCANFLKLVDSGFYNGLKFHRVEDWVVQGGDPKGDGTGGPGWEIKLETHPSLRNLRGALAMARAENPDSAGSQFYILKQDASWLDGQYAVFGKVTQGMELIDKLEIGDSMKIERAK